MSDTQATTSAQDILDKTVAEGSACEALRKYLLEQGQCLQQTAERFNASHPGELNDSQMDVIGWVRIRTGNNCIARDIVQVGDCLLLGYNVFIDLRKEAGVADVFFLYRLVGGSEGYEVEPVLLEDSFLATPGFISDFDELYTYYKNTHLLQLTIHDGKLLASLQIGERVIDIRVFRWSISSDGSEVCYVDNCDERDIALPVPFDFEWQRVTREMVVEDRFPHLNVPDTLFVETIGGDLTIKVENNTEVGPGIYHEEVMGKTQSLDDAQVEFARLGSLLLFKVLPYREEQWRYLMFNSLTGKVECVDAIGLACTQLPEDHGTIFPGGYHLQNGEYRTFGQSMEGMRFKRLVHSPSDEDVQYVFYHPEQGRDVLFTYNLISRQLQNPLFNHGYVRLEDGHMVTFAAENKEPTHIHPIQVQQTPFRTEEYTVRQPAHNDFLRRIDDAELVHGTSDLYDLYREIEIPTISVRCYSLLCQNIQRLFNVCHWLGSDQLDGLAPLLREVAATTELVLDEYEKVESIHRQLAQAMVDAEERHKVLLFGLLPDGWDRVQQSVDGLNGITTQHGLLLTIHEYRYIDVARLDGTGAELLMAHKRVAVITAIFLASEQALRPLLGRP